MALTILNGPLVYGLTGVNLQYTAHDGLPDGDIVLREMDGANPTTNIIEITATSVTETSAGNGIVVFDIPEFPASGGFYCIDLATCRVELS